MDGSITGSKDPIDAQNTIKILLTTDNHVGYKENDPIRGDDSWRTFDEIVVLAKDHDVDMILHGGDLFHVNKPSKKSMYHVMESLRLHCLGDRPCELELLSDPLSITGGGSLPVNYEDPNINISIPIFAINGNHDDLTGPSLLLPMDLLSVSGLVNHFGKVTDNEKVTISPILLQKGSTKFALYGMGNVKDERLFRLFRDGKVKFLRPNVETDSWFNVLCVHQNHAAHTKTSYLPEQFIPSFFDFVYWGHEHECIPVPQFNPITSFHTLQAGSSIATSLSDGEAAPKNVFILSMKGRNFNVEPLPLKTVRPFLLSHVSLADEGFTPGLSSNTDISRFLSSKVEELIQQAMLDYIATHATSSNDPEALAQIKREAPLPLIRLKVDTTGNFELENPQRLSKKFVGRVANIDDIFLFHQRPVSNSKMNLISRDNNKIDKGIGRSETTNLSIDSLIGSFVQDVEFNLLSNEGITNAVRSFVTKEDKHVINDFLRKETKTHADSLVDLNIGKDQLLTSDIDARAAFKALLAKLRLENKKQLLKETDDMSDDGGITNVNRESPVPPQRLLRAKPQNTKKQDNKGKKSKEVVVDSDSGLDDDDEYVNHSEPEAMVEFSDDDDGSEFEEPPKPKESTRKAASSSRGGTRGTKSARGGSSARGNSKAKPRKNQTQESTQSNLLDTLLNISKN